MPSPLRSALFSALTMVAAGGVVTLLTSVAHDAWQAIQQPGPAAASDGLLLVVAVVGAWLAVWFVASVLLAALAALPGRAGTVCRILAERTTPIVLRRAVGVMLGTTLTAVALPATVNADPVAGGGAHQLVAAGRLHAGMARSAAGPLAASTSAAMSAAQPALDEIPHGSAVQEPRPELTVTAGDSGPSPAWTPSRPQPAVRHAKQPSLDVLDQGRTTRRPADEDAVVRRGDTLWDIAARHLGAGATAAEVALEWPRWFAANRSVIGSDPDMILPGQRLLPPTADGPPTGRHHAEVHLVSGAQRRAGERDPSDARSRP